MILYIRAIPILFLFSCVLLYTSDNNNQLLKVENKKIDYTACFLNVGSTAVYYAGQSLSSVVSCGTDMFATAIRKSMPYESYVENIRDNSKLFRDIETFIRSDTVYSDEFVRKIKKLRNRSYYGALYLLKNCDTKIPPYDTDESRCQNSEEIVLDGLSQNVAVQEELLSTRSSLSNIYKENSPVLKTALNEKLYSYASSGNKNHFLRVSSAELHKITSSQQALISLWHANYIGTHNDFKNLIAIESDSKSMNDSVETRVGVHELYNAIYEQHVLHNMILNEVSKVYTYSAMNRGIATPSKEICILNDIKENHQACGRIAPLYGQLLDFGLDLGEGKKIFRTE